ncbi:MAG TPA: hypothetical protein ENL44_02520 [Thermoplasmatales archaeon]|nr:hypothetical protein [Thermoplasmatales archaeon]
MRRALFALLSASLLILLALTTPVTAEKIHFPLTIKLHRMDFRSFNFSAVNKTDVLIALFFTFLAVIYFHKAIAVFRHSEFTLENIMLALLWMQFSLYSAMIAIILILNILMDMGVILTEDK